MQGTLRHLRHSPAPAPGRLPCQVSNPSRLIGTRFRRSTAPALPSTAPQLSIGRSLSSQAVLREATHNAWSVATSKEPTPAPKLPGLSKDGRLGQAGEPTETFLSIRRHVSGELDPQARKSIHAALARLRSGDITHWERFITTTRHNHGDEGVWEVFRVIRKRNFNHLLTETHSAVIRDHILASALNADDRIDEVFEVAKQLLHEKDFQWPHLYTKILNFYLDQGAYQHAFLWHLRLTPIFPPSLETFGALLASYVLDPSPHLQSCLTAMYVSNSHRKLYDYLIPSLFTSGQSKLARVWRKKLLAFQDVPESPKSTEFLQFLSLYYPTLQLTEEELVIAGLEDQLLQAPSKNWKTRQSAPSGGYTDAFTAQWFATSWTSAEFAIDLAHKLGLRVIGPRALQALALREENARGVANRISQMERLGINIIPRAYSRALVFFAKHGEEEFLAGLLASDIHPDEFDWPESRESLMVEAAERGDWVSERLLEGVEWGLKDRSPVRELNWLLLTTLFKRVPEITKARIVLDRMTSMNVKISKNAAGILLVRIFRNLAFHPARGKQPYAGYGNDPQLDRAINVCRRLTAHDVAIRNYYWAMLIYNLGRWGRFNELEQLCLEIVRRYKPSSGGLIPVHHKDLPLRESNQPRPPPEEEKVLVTTKLSETSDEFFTPLAVESVPSRSRYSETFLKAEMGENYKDPVTRLEEQEEKNRQRKPSRYSEEFLRAEIGDTYKDPCRMSPEAETKALETQARRLEPKVKNARRTHFIPADLPFSHRQHPMQKLFKPRLQRAILRWSFDKTLAVEPSKASLLGLQEVGSDAFDVARGVHLLAKLRDEGVLIDKQIIRSAVISRMALAHVPGRDRDRARDQNEVTPEKIKALVDKAWGSEILPPMAELLEQLENHKPKQWNNYPKLYERAYDSKDTRGDFPEEEEGIYEDEEEELKAGHEAEISAEKWEEELNRYTSKSH